MAHDEDSGAVVNVAPRQTRRRSHHAKPGSDGSPQMVNLIADARCEEAASPSRLVHRALATHHHALPVVATRFVLMGVLWVTWQPQSLGAATCAAVVFDDHVALDGVSRSRTSAVSSMQNPGVCGVQETQGSRERVLLRSWRGALSTTTWQCMS